MLLLVDLIWNESTLNCIGGPRDIASKHRRSRHKHMFRRRSVPSNDTLSSSPFSDRRRTSTAPVVAAGGDSRPRATTPTQPDIRLTAAVRPTRDGGLEVLVSWQWTVFRESASTDKKPFEFTIHWARKTCNVDERLPHCDDPDAYYSNTVWSHGSKVRIG